MAFFKLFKNMLDFYNIILYTIIKLKNTYRIQGGIKNGK